MKKGTKAAVITALTCIAAGLILTGAGAAAGGAEQLEQGDFRYIHFDKDDTELADLIGLFPWGRLKRAAGIDNVGGSYNGEKEEKGEEVFSGDFEKDIAYSGALRKLETNVGVHILEIEEADGSGIHLSGKNCDRIQCYVKDGTLCIKDVGKNKKYTRVNDRELVLTVPAGIRWDAAEISAAIGGVEIGALAADKVSLEVDMGNITVETLTADKLEVDADMGNVEVSEAQAGRLEAEADMGSFSFDGIVDGDIDAEARMGSITLNLYQSEEDFNYEISAGMGSVTVDGADYSGLSREKRIDNNAGKKMHLNSSMGSIDIYFE